MTRHILSLPLARRLKMFKWHNHVEGKLHCVEGLVQDINMHPGGPGGIEDLPRDAIAGLFKDAQEKNRPDEVVRLAQTLAQGGASNRWGSSSPI